MPIADLPGNPVFDEKNLSLRSSEAVCHIGDRIRICVEEADIPTRRVRFSLEKG